MPGRLGVLKNLESLAIVNNFYHRTYKLRVSLNCGHFGV